MGRRVIATAPVAKYTDLQNLTGKQRALAELLESKANFCVTDSEIAAWLFKELEPTPEQMAYVYVLVHRLRMKGHKLGVEATIVRSHTRGYRLVTADAKAA